MKNGTSSLPGHNRLDSGLYSSHTPKWNLESGTAVPDTLLMLLVSGGDKNYFIITGNDENHVWVTINDKTEVIMTTK